MNIVAHQDDDLLFMNPAIQKAIQAGHSILTVFITAGDAAVHSVDFWARGREAGSRAAYATMAGLPEVDSDANWAAVNLPSGPMNGVKLLQLRRDPAQAPIYLAFFRLPSTFESGVYDSDDEFPNGYKFNNGYPGSVEEISRFETLRRFWLGDIPNIHALYDPNFASDPTNLGDGVGFRSYTNTFTRESLTGALTALMEWFQPAVVRCQDHFGLNELPVGRCDFVEPSGPVDSSGRDLSGVRVSYPSQNFPADPCYYYDHSDHYFSGLIAQAALSHYIRLSGNHPTFAAYRDYSSALLPSNLAAEDIQEKTTTFIAYGAHDENVGTSPPFDSYGHYMSWLARQYEVTHPYGFIVQQDQPVAYWRLEEPGGSLAADSILGIYGLLHGGATLDAEGIPSGELGKAVHFTAASQQWMEAPFVAELNSPRFSVEVWARITTPRSAFRSVVTSRAIAPLAGYMIYATPENTWEFWTGSENALEWDKIHGPQIQTDAWEHLVGICDGITKRFYVNGVLVGISAAPFVPNAKNPLRLGAGSTESASDFFFEGDLAELAIYGKALSDDQVRVHYLAGQRRFVPKVSIARVQSTALIRWDGGLLESSRSPVGPWSEVPGAVTSPFVPPAPISAFFFRARR